MPGAFAYSAVKVKGVHQSDTELKIEGERVALIFEPTAQPLPANNFHFVRLSDSVNIAIALDASHPEGLDAEIKKIFAFSLQDDFSGRSGDEVKTALATLGLVDSSNKIPDLGTPSELPRAKVGGDYSLLPGGVAPPRLLYIAKPVENDPTATK